MTFPGKMIQLSLAAALLIISQSSFAAFSFATAEYLGISDIRTSGTASVAVLFEDPIYAEGSTDFGIPDFFNDGFTFSSETSPFGEGTATNSGFTASSLAESSAAFIFSYADTFSEVVLEIDGEGDIEIDFDYAIFTDTVLAGTDGYAAAGVAVGRGPAFLTASLFSEVYGGLGSVDELYGSLTMTLFADGTGPYLEFITVDTFAETEVFVPVPAAVWLMGSALIGLLGFRRN